MNTAILLAVFNGLWQGVALVAITAVALRCWKARNAATTCAVWSAVYLAVALLPIVDVALQYRVTAAPATVATVLTTIADYPEQRIVGAPVFMDGPAMQSAHVSPVRETAGPVPAARSLLAQIDEAARSIGTRASGIAAGAGLPLFVLWAVITLLLLARLVRGYASVLGLKRAATPLTGRHITDRIAAASRHRNLTIATSERIGVPCAVGFLHPMILLPAPLADTLDADDLARIVLHELAHLQRHDDWLNAAQRAIGAIFFFQPALAFVSRQIDLTREIACDDRVLETTGEPIRYAECLTKIVERRVRGRVAAVPGFVFGPAQVVERVRTIVERRGAFSSRITRSAGAAAFAVAIVALAIARIQVPVVAQSAQPPARALAFVVQDAPQARPTAFRETPQATRATHAATPLKRPTAVTAAIAPATTARVATGRYIVRAEPAGRPETRVVSRAGDFVNVDVRVAADPTSAPLPPLPPVRPLPAMPPMPPTPAIRGFAFPRLTVYRPARVDVLDALDAGGYGHPSVDELIALRNAGVDGAYIKAMSLGHGRPALSELIDFRNRGLSPEFVRDGLQRFGSGLQLQDLAAARDAGVTSGYLARLSALGYNAISLKDAIQLANQGVTTLYIRELSSAGYTKLTIMQLIALRNSGIDSAYIRRLTAHGYPTVTVDQLITLKASGVQPK